MIISAIVASNGYPAPTGGQHITLIYMGDSEADSQVPNTTLQHMQQLCYETAQGVQPFIVPVTEFGSLGDSQVLFLQQDSGLENLRDELLQDPVVTEWMSTTDQFPSYTPHMSISYPEEGDPTYEEFDTSEPLTIIGISLGVSDQAYEYLFETDSGEDDIVAPGVDGELAEDIAEADESDADPLAMAVVEMDSFDPLMAAAGDWDPHLHPRGKDGKFIKKFGIVKFLDALSGKWSYGKVVGISEGKDKHPDITVRPSDLFGKPTGAADIDMPPSKLYEAPKPQAHALLNDPNAKKIGGQAGSNPGGLYELPNPDAAQNPGVSWDTLVNEDVTGRFANQQVTVVNPAGNSFHGTLKYVSSDAQSEPNIYLAVDNSSNKIPLNANYQVYLDKSVEQTGEAPPTAVKYYIKQAKTPQHGKNEALANDLYAEAGVYVPQVDYNTADGNIYSKIVPGTQDMESHLSAKDTTWMQKVQENFAVDAWLGNRDVFGMTYDNILTDEFGTPVRIDNGGALLYRAQGAKKTDFGSEVTELTSFRTGKKAVIFGTNMPKSAELDGAQRVVAISPQRIEEMVASHGLPKSLADTLKARRVYLANYYGLPLPESIQPPGSDHPTSAPLVDALDAVKGGGLPRTWSPKITKSVQLLSLVEEGDQIITADGVTHPVPMEGLTKNGTVLALAQNSPFQVKKADHGFPRPPHNLDVSASPGAAAVLASYEWQRGDQIVVQGDTLDVYGINYSNGQMLVSPQSGGPNTPFFMNIYNLPGDKVTIKRWDPPAASDTLPQPSQKTGLAVDIENKVKADLVQPLPDKGPALPGKTEAKPGEGIGDKGVKTMPLGDGTVAKTGDTVVSKKDGKSWVFVKPKGYSAVVYDPADPEKKPYMKTASTLTQPDKAPDASLLDAVDTPKSSNGVVPEVGLKVTAKDGKTGLISWVSPDGKSLLFKETPDSKPIKKTTTAVAIEAKAPEAPAVSLDGPATPTAGTPSPGNPGLPGHTYSVAMVDMFDEAVAGWSQQDIKDHLWAEKDLIPGQSMVYAADGEGVVHLEKWANQPWQSLYISNGMILGQYSLPSDTATLIQAKDLPSLPSTHQCYRVLYQGNILYGTHVDSDGSFTGQDTNHNWFNVPADAHVLATAANLPWPTLASDTPPDFVSVLDGNGPSVPEPAGEGDFKTVKNLMDAGSLVLGAQLSTDGNTWYTVQDAHSTPWGTHTVVTDGGTFTGGGAQFLFKPAPAKLIAQPEHVDETHLTVESAPSASFLLAADGSEYTKVGNNLYEGRTLVGTVDKLQGTQVQVISDYTTPTPSPIEFHDLVTLASNNIMGTVTINGDKYLTHGVVTDPNFTPHVLLMDSKGQWVDGTTGMFIGAVDFAGGMPAPDQSALFPPAATKLIGDITKGKSWASPATAFQLSEPKLLNDLGTEYQSPVDIYAYNGLYLRRGPLNEVQQWNPSTKSWDTAEGKANLPTGAVKVIDGKFQATEVNYQGANLAGKVNPKIKNLPVYSVPFVDGSNHTAYKLGEDYYLMKPDGSMSSVKVSDMLIHDGVTPTLEHDPWAPDKTATLTNEVKAGQYKPDGWTSTIPWPENGKVVEFSLADGQTAYAVKPTTGEGTWTTYTEGLTGLPSTFSDTSINTLLTSDSTLFHVKLVHDGTPVSEPTAPEAGKPFVLGTSVFPPGTLAYNIAGTNWVQHADGSWDGYAASGLKITTTPCDNSTFWQFKAQMAQVGSATLISGSEPDNGFDWKTKDFSFPAGLAPGQAKFMDGTPLDLPTLVHLSDATETKSVPAGSLVYLTSGSPHTSSLWVTTPDGQHFRYMTGIAEPLPIKDSVWQELTAGSTNVKLSQLDLNTFPAVNPPEPVVTSPNPVTAAEGDLTVPYKTGVYKFTDGSLVNEATVDNMSATTAAHPIPAGSKVYAKKDGSAYIVVDPKATDGDLIATAYYNWSDPDQYYSQSAVNDVVTNYNYAEVDMASLTGVPVEHTPVAANVLAHDYSFPETPTGTPAFLDGTYLSPIQVMKLSYRTENHPVPAGSKVFMHTSSNNVYVLGTDGSWQHFSVFGPKPVDTEDAQFMVDAGTLKEVNIASFGDPTLTPVPQLVKASYQDLSSYKPVTTSADIKPGDYVYLGLGTAQTLVHVTAVKGTTFTYDKSWNVETWTEHTFTVEKDGALPKYAPYTYDGVSVLSAANALEPGTPVPLQHKISYLDTAAYEDVHAFSDIKPGDWVYNAEGNWIMHVTGSNGSEFYYDKLWYGEQQKWSSYVSEQSPSEWTPYSYVGYKVLHNGTDEPVPLTTPAAPQVATPSAPSTPDVSAPSVPEKPAAIPGVTAADAAAKAAWGGDVTKSGHIPFPGMEVFGIKGLQGKIISISPDKTKATVLSADGTKTTRKISALKSNIAGNYAAHAGPVAKVDIPDGMNVPYDPPSTVFDKAYKNTQYIGGLVNSHPGVKNAATVVKSAKAPNGTTYARVHFTMTTEQRAAFVAMVQGQGPSAQKGDWVTGNDKKLGELQPGDVVSLRHSSSQSEWVPDKNGINAPTHKLVSVGADGTYTFEALDGGGTITTPFTKKTTSSGVDYTIHTFAWDPNKVKPIPTTQGFKGLSPEAVAQGWKYSASKSVIPAASTSKGTISANPGEWASSSHIDTDGGFILKMADGTVVDIVNPLPGQNSEQGIVTISIPQGGDAPAAYGAALHALGMSHMPTTQANVKEQVRAALVNMLYLDASKPDSSKGWSDEKIFKMVGDKVGIPDVGWQDVRIGVQPEQGRTEFFWSDRVTNAIAAKSSWNVVARGGKSYEKVVDVVKYGALDATTRRFLGFDGAGNGHSSDSSNNAGNGSFMSGGTAAKFVTGNPINTGYGGGYAVYHDPRALFSRIGDIRPAHLSNDAFGKGQGTGSSAFDGMMNQPYSYDLWMAGGLPADTIGYIAMNSEGQRMDVINKLHADGIYQIGNRPLEDVIQTASTLNATQSVNALPPYLPNNLVDLLSLPAE